MASIPDPRDYHVSEKVGFLLEDPLDTLPPYFEPWNKIGKNLCRMTEDETLRAEVNKMGVLDHTKLRGYRQHHLAYTILANACNCYVLQGRGKDIVKVLPEQIAVPLYAIATYLGLKPLTSYVSICTSNYTFVDPNGPLTTDNMEIIVPLPGGVSARWLCLATNEVETAAVPAMFAIPEALKAIVADDGAKVISELNTMTASTKAMTAAMARIHEHCDPNKTLTDGLVYFKTWGGPMSPLPDGLIYDGVNSNKPMTFTRGASAAQTLTTQSLDVVLGISHTQAELESLEDLLDHVQPAHRRYIQALRKAPCIRDYVKSKPGDVALQTAYNDCVEALTDFRSYHVQIITKYVVGPMNKFANETTPLLSTAINQPLTNFLKGIRDSTKENQI